MNKKRIYFLLYVGLIIIVSLTVLFTLLSKKEVVSNKVDIMELAVNNTNECFNEIKNYKIENGIEIPEYDVLNTGMIGTSKLTSITTTEGILEAKRTACNPNWAGVIVSYFIKAGLVKGDEVGFVFSGSFPTLDIACICAAEAYGLKYCCMFSIGASYYGANLPEFTILDMFSLLYNKGHISKLPDYVSLGGNNDIGDDFSDLEEKNSILNRISQSGINFIYEEDFEKNIDLRISYYKSVVPNMKLFISCGGTMVAFGKGLEVFLDSGYFDGDELYSWSKTKNTGLLSYYKACGIPVVSMVNIKYLAKDFNIPYDPIVNPILGINSNCYCYYEITYNLVIPIIGLILVLFLLIYICIFKYKYKNDLVNIKKKYYKF